jgi:formate C-acetyltransferase
MATRPQPRYDIDAIKRAYLDAPDSAVFLERARILGEAESRYAGLPPRQRQGRIIADLCARITIAVNPSDVFLGRILEETPSAADEEFIREHPELFIEPGVPGVLDSASIYCPDWSKLLALGIRGLVEEVEGHERRANATADASLADYLEGVRLSLRGVSELAVRFAQEARRRAAASGDTDARSRLAEAALSCERIALLPPESFRDALQLFILFHTVLSSVIGARNVTPGRMDQWLSPYYERDVAPGRSSREEAVELVAAVMVMMSQGSGHVLTDFQSTKRTPNRHSHYYITVAGVTPGGECAANDLSSVILDALRLTGLREPSIEIRYSDGIDRSFWHKALGMMREGLPLLAYNDDAVIAALAGQGTPESVARDYVHAGCMNCILPGRGVPCLRDNHNMPLSILSAANGGYDPLTGQQLFPDAPPADALGTFDEFFDALRAHVRFELKERLASYRDIARRLPLPAWPLFEGHLEEGVLYWERQAKFVDQHLVSVATSVDSLLAIDEAVYRSGRLELAELARILKDDFAGREDVRAFLANRAPSYGTDEPDVLRMIERLGRMWVEEVEGAGEGAGGMRLRPGFHSWLYNLELGAATGATPDGRRRGEPFSSDLLPSEGKGRVPTATLGCMARLPHDRTVSGGTTIVLDGAHFEGEGGLERLSALAEGYFAEGGLQIHFIFTDAATLSDAVDHPERHADLLVRVTGYSEYFVRLLPEVQRDIIRRARR